MNGHPMTNATAGAAITSPLWLHPLEQISAAASILLPILGVAWLAVQIALKAHEIWGRRGK